MDDIMEQDTMAQGINPGDAEEMTRRDDTRETSSHSTHPV
jgi:hypothetical protein